MKLNLVLLALVVVAAGWAPSASADYQKDLAFSGSVTSNGTLFVQTRDGGTPLYTTSSIALSNGQSPTVVRNNCGVAWRVGGCIEWDGARLFIIESVPFTIWGSTNGSSWTQITSGSPYSTNGITLSVTNNPPVLVPTLAEWGLILLAGTILCTGVWMLQRRSRQPQSA